jgi:hypothetical protein
VVTLVKFFQWSEDHLICPDTARIDFFASNYLPDVVSLVPRISMEQKNVVSLFIVTKQMAQAGSWLQGFINLTSDRFTPG